MRYVTDPEGHVTELRYDAQHRPDWMRDPLGNVTDYLFDGEHHLREITDAENNQKTRTFYPEGMLWTETSGKGVLTEFVYDAYGAPFTVTTGNHPPEQMIHTPEGLLGNYISREGSEYRLRWDEDKPSSITDPLGKTKKFTIDGDQSVDGVLDRNGTQVFYERNQRNEIKDIHVGSLDDPPVVSFTRKADGSIEYMSDPAGTTHYFRDDLGRVTHVTDPHAFAVGYGYDEAGNIEEITYPGNKTVSYTYDDLNRLKSVSTWLGDAMSFEYDDAGRLAYVIGFDGIRTDYGYDRADRLIDLASPVAQFHFRDALGNPSLDGNGNPRVVQQSISPPSFGPTQVSYRYNPSKTRLESAGQAAFDYDHEGRLTAGYGYYYFYDYAHRLTGVAFNPDGTGEIASFKYDGQGRRLVADRSGSGKTYYIYGNNGNVLAEANEQKQIIRYYIHAMGLAAMITPDGKTYSYHYDPSGNTVAMTNDLGEVVNRYSYSPFGDYVSVSEQVYQPFRFSGRFGAMEEPELLLYFIKARFYDPQTGRFISEDPRGLRLGQPNLYAYADNNPVCFVDPDGEALVGALIGAAVGGVSGYFSGTLDNKSGVELTLSIFAGALEGAFIGAIDPTGGVGTTLKAVKTINTMRTLVTYGTIGVGVGITQESLSSIVNNRPLAINQYSLLASGLGGAVGGYAGKSFSLLASKFTGSELIQGLTGLGSTPFGFTYTTLSYESFTLLGGLDTNLSD